MTELRKDPIINRWVIIASDRSKRPSDMLSSKQERNTNIICPFDEGQEHKTPPEVFAIRKTDSKPNSDGWNIRVVPNRFPALSHEKEYALIEEDLNLTTTGFGFHEVLIEGKTHDLQLIDFDETDFFNVLKVWQERLKYHKDNKNIKYIQLIKNHGKKGGASLEHSHSQLFALPFVPNLVQQELDGAHQYQKKHHSCVYCDLIKTEKNKNVRIVFETSEAISFCPHASRYPYETWVLLKKHAPNFESMDEHELKSFSATLQTTLKAINKTLNNPSYNFVLHTSPTGDELKLYHWHIEIIPITTSIAGFERATECYINTISPETAAKDLLANL